MTVGNTVFAIECKASLSPTLSKGNYNAFEDISPKKVFIVSPRPTLNLLAGVNVEGSISISMYTMHSKGFC